MCRSPVNLRAHGRNFSYADKCPLVKSSNIQSVGWLHAEFAIAQWNAAPEKTILHPQITQICTDYLKENLRKSA